MPRSKPKLVLVIVVVLVAAAAAIIARSLAVRGEPLVGETSHVFEPVELTPGQTAELHHTFVLINSSDRPVTVLAARPDCACVSSRINRQVIEPGAEFRLPVTMRLQSASKVVLIHLDLGDDGAQTLRVTGTATMR